MHIRVYLFAQEAQLAGRSHVDLDLPPDASTCAQIRAALAATQPRLGALIEHGRIAVNHAFAPDDHRVAEHDEVALIGMVSGG